MSRRNRHRERGFSLIEVFAAVLILTIGVTGLAGLAGVMLTRGRQSKYMTLASTLASEKLEDLNRWNSNADPVTGNDLSAPAICVPSGSNTVGSITSDAPQQTVTCNGTGVSSNSAIVNYYDNVSIDVASIGNNTDCGANNGNSNAGCFSETTQSTVSGTTTYVTTYHSPDGNITSVSSTTPPTSLTFHRRWLIEANTPVAGVTSGGTYIPGTRRITVFVQLLDTSVVPAVTYQMSMVRP